MTKFMNIPNPSNNEDKKKEFKPTVFTHVISSDKIIEELEDEPIDFDNIIWLGCDKHYGDVFKAWDNDEINNFAICLGVKGDEEYL